MASDHPDILSSLAAIQGEFRKLLPAGGASEALAASPRASPPADDMVTEYLKEALSPVPQSPALGCRLLHWNPELEKFRVEVMFQGRPESLVVYRPLDVRIDGRPHVFFAKVYKTKYAKPGQSRSDPTTERQFGVTYSDRHPKREVTPVLDAFKQCATEAGVLVASLKERLASVLPAETLAAKNDIHRWIFTVYDVAWKAPPGSPRAATKYIPVKGFNAFMTTDESIKYDLDHIRSTPWSEIERRLDPNRWGSAVNLEGPYASWSKELPEYYASRIDDIVQASDWTIDWLVKQLEGH